MCTLPGPSILTELFGKGIPGNSGAPGHKKSPSKRSWGLYGFQLCSREERRTRCTGALLRFRQSADSPSLLTDLSVASSACFRGIERLQKMVAVSGPRGARWSDTARLQPHGRNHVAKECGPDHQEHSWGAGHGPAANRLTRTLGTCQRSQVKSLTRTGRECPGVASGA
jgi:hypothetical protein